jgi:hypothetical protein
MHVSIMSLAGRVAAAASEKLGLGASGALCTFLAYDVESPMRSFLANVDELGECLSATDQDDFMAELPKALQKTSLLLDALARR